MFTLRKVKFLANKIDAKQECPDYGKCDWCDPDWWEKEEN